MVYRLVYRNHRQLSALPQLYLNLSLFQPLRPHDHFDRNTDQIDIFQFNADSKIPVIQQRFGAKLPVNFFGGLQLLFVFGINGNDRDFNRGQRRRPDDPVFIVPLLDRRGDDSADADTVTAHNHRLFFVLFVDIDAIHFGGIFGPEFKNMADFNPPFSVSQFFFSAVGDNVEFFGKLPAHQTGIGILDAIVQAHPVKNAAVGGAHIFIFFVKRRFRSMKRIGVFHNKFPAPHDAEARADLVAEFGLDLEKGDRELLVRLDRVAGKGGNDFFVGRAEAEFVFVAVGNPEKFLAVFSPAPRFFPDLFWKEGRHEDFLRAGIEHLFTDDLGYFCDCTESQG